MQPARYFINTSGARHYAINESLPVIRKMRTDFGHGMMNLLVLSGHHLDETSLRNLWLSQWILLHMGKDCSRQSYCIPSIHGGCKDCWKSCSRRFQPNTSYIRPGNPTAFPPSMEVARIARNLVPDDFNRILPVFVPVILLHSLHPWRLCAAKIK